MVTTLPAAIEIAPVVLFGWHVAASGLQVLIGALVVAAVFAC
jgi:hypothetical protein